LVKKSGFGQETRFWSKMKFCPFFKVWVFSGIFSILWLGYFPGLVRFLAVFFGKIECRPHFDVPMFSNDI